MGKKTDNLPAVRKSRLMQEVGKSQSEQLQQSNQLLKLDNDFKKLRILQLEDELKEFIKYYETHGDFYKRHPVSGEILRNTNGIAMQIKVPNISREIRELKESITMSEGVKNLIEQIDDIINTGPQPDNIYEGEDAVVDAEFSEIFAQSDD